MAVKSLSIDFYFLWELAGHKGFEGSLFAALILVYLLCLKNSHQTFLGRAGELS